MTRNAEPIHLWRKCKAWSWLLSLVVLVAVVRAQPTQVALLLGDSLTAGYGVEPEEAYPALLQKKIDEARLPWRIVNAGVSGDTSAGGLRRIDWLLRQKVDLVLVELGGNDGLRGVTPATTEKNLLGIIEKIRSRSPATQIVVAGMQMPPNMGETFRAEFAAVFPRVATATQSTLIPSFLEGVGGDPAFNLPDGIHPTPAGHARIAETVWPYLLPLLTATPPSPATP